MKWWLTGSLLGLSLLAVNGRVVAGQPPPHPTLSPGAGGVGRGRGPAAQQAGWFTDYQAAKAAARSSRKPLFLVFRCQP
jgi:hypothetical protein